MDTADARPGDVAGPEAMGGAVETRLDFTLEDEVGLLEGMVVGSGQTIRLVLDHEHGRQVGTLVRVDHHLHGDPAVDQQRGAHAGADGQAILGLPGGIHRFGRDVPEVAVPRIAHVDRLWLCRCNRRGDELGVVPEALAGQGSAHLRELGDHLRGVAQRVGHADREQAVVPTLQPVAALRGVEGECSCEHVNRLFERVDVGGDAAPGLEASDAKTHLHRTSGLVDDGSTAVADATAGELGWGGERQVGHALDDVRHLALSSRKKAAMALRSRSP